MQLRQIQVNPLGMTANSLTTSTQTTSLLSGVYLRPATNIERRLDSMRCGSGESLLMKGSSVNRRQNAPLMRTIRRR
jgi:hypothetical protein